MPESRSNSPLSSYPRKLSVFQWKLGLVNSIVASSLVVVDRKSVLMYFFGYCKNVVIGNTTKENSMFVRKTKFC